MDISQPDSVDNHEDSFDVLENNNKINDESIVKPIIVIEKRMVIFFTIIIDALAT